jgi:hypothetical protein
VGRATRTVDSARYHGSPMAMANVNGPSPQTLISEHVRTEVVVHESLMIKN